MIIGNYSDCKSTNYYYTVSSDSASVGSCGSTLTDSLNTRIKYYQCSSIDDFYKSKDKYDNYSLVFINEDNSIYMNTNSGLTKFTTNPVTTEYSWNDNKTFSVTDNEMMI